MLQQIRELQKDLAHLSSQPCDWRAVPESERPRYLDAQYRGSAHQGAVREAIRPSVILPQRPAAEMQLDESQATAAQLAKLLLPAQAAAEIGTEQLSTPAPVAGAASNPVLLPLPAPAESQSAGAATLVSASSTTAPQLNSNPTSMHKAQGMPAVVVAVPAGFDHHFFIRLVFVGQHGIRPYTALPLLWADL